ncbi:MAG: hypothetical protein WCD89_06835 [Anaerocolumna sp.]
MNNNYTNEVRKQSKVLSLDIWDTVIRRRCYPDESKFGLSKYVLIKYYPLLKDKYKKSLPFDLVKIRQGFEYSISRNNMIMGFDDEYDINEVLSYWSDELMINLSYYRKNLLLEEFIEYELKHECYISYLDPEIIDKIKRINYEKLIYISDFYMNHTLIDRILKPYGNRIRFDLGFVSCEYNLNKKSGRLYKKVEEELSLNAKNHYHIGDNKLSDVIVPHKMGIESRRYFSIHETIRQMRHTSDYMFRSRIKRPLQKRKLFGYFLTLKKQLKTIKSDNPYMKLGINHSLYYITYVLAIIESAIKEQVDKVYYFTREGEFFSQIHNEIQKANIFGFPIPEAIVLEVSRMATFAPSIQEISIDGMIRLWSQYPDQSVETFFKSLHIESDSYRFFFEKYGIHNTNRPIKKIYKDDSIKQLFGDKQFRNKLGAEIEKKRCLLLKYFEQKGIHKEMEKLFVVDIGWRGSIQDNIALLLPNTEVVGYYMGLFHSYYDKVLNSRKLCFVKSKGKDNYLWYLRHPYPIEMYTNSKNGSVTGYQESDDGSVKAVRNNYSKEDFVFDKYVKYYQKGVLMSVPESGGMIRTFSFTTAELMPYAMRILKKMMINPDKLFIRPFFELVDNNMFGIGKLENMACSVNIINLFKSLFSSKDINKLIDLVEASHWPNGVLIRQHLSVLNWFYSRLAKKMYVNYHGIIPLKYSDKVKFSCKRYKRMDLKLSYTRAEVIKNPVGIYIRGRITVPKNSDYEILVWAEKRTKKILYNTQFLLNNGGKDENVIYFEAKIPGNTITKQDNPIKILMFNREKREYEIFLA